jgi:putative ABC transport system permease protein
VYSLFLHKLRSGLAVLGILIGIMAVIWLVAMGEGVSYQAQQQIKDLGARNVIVRTVKPPQQASNGRSGLFVQYGILRADFARIMANLPFITEAVPMREIRTEARFEARTIEARLVGCTSDYDGINRLTIDRGRFLEDADNNPPQNFAVLAADTAQSLFPYEDPLDRVVLINGDFYRIVGVTAARDPSAAIGGSLDSQDYNNDIYIPLETLRTRIGDMVFTSRSGSREGEIVELSQITLTVPDLDLVEPTADVIRNLLETYHKDQNDFGVVVPKELLRQAERLRMMFNGLLILIAGISLVVGGIGIMNIMLATVTERTREIGVRRALGAKRRDIIQQFLIEAVVLTSIGGVLGVALGFLVGPTVTVVRLGLVNFAPDLANSLPSTIMELEPRVQAWSIIASLAISIGVGVLFGLYPARRAAMMDPIEALRHE